MRAEIPTVRLRPATAADYDFMRRVHHSGMRWIAERLFGPWDAAAQDEKFERQFVLDEARIVAAAGSEAGYLQLGASDGELFLRELHIDAPFQNRGIGTEVLRLVLAEAGTIGKPVIVAVVKINPARALYERCGFRTFREDEYKFYMRHDGGA
jgi:ribosomal protein S18 acetylase RimI-like enzyme